MIALASIVSERYALSLYEVAKAEGLAEQFLEELRGVAGVFEEYPDYLKVLVIPSIAFEEKKTSLNEVFAGRVHPYMLNFLMLITEKGRVGAIAEMAEAYKELYYFEEGICEVVAVTAAPMTAGNLEKLKEKMESVTGKKVVLNNKVDPKVIGGIMVRIENKQIDATIKTRLNELARQLSQTIA
ncbi:MAG: ATP synthase F1 subunit delta [Butyricicoccus sp.]